MATSNDKLSDVKTSGDRTQNYRFTVFAMLQQLKKSNAVGVISFKEVGEGLPLQQTPVPHGLPDKVVMDFVKVLLIPDNAGHHPDHHTNVSTDNTIENLD